MKSYHKLLLTLSLFICSVASFAQQLPPHLDSLMKAGLKLSDAGKFAEAIANYDEVLKAAPDNMGVLYEKGFTLSVSGKNDDAVPLFEKVIAIAKMPQAYAALANIYDVKGDFDKATKYYTEGIAVSPRDRNLWFNLAVSYTRQKKYTQAEQAATESIKIDRRHAGSHHIYAVACYLQGKNAQALLGFSNFLMLGPPPRQAAPDCMFIKAILHANPDPKADAMAKLQQETIAQAVTSSTAGKTNLTATDSLTMQLTAAYKAIKTQEDQYGSPFFSKYFGNFFGDIAATDYMDVYTRFVSVSLSPQENLAWLKAHPDNIKAFNTWLNTEKRQTE
ncbi:tetratricopeptide repeat protein [Mucilaginibacter sp. dw_454]|uniref:tetratricopeptide repeat protein n=1 Tax=Mucilaginibacter sp. dw_454 TaxID=2720079 RepID=UPI001BD44E48|nr:tetratricopeptide repeat protein [Mucilaginibacter sp. dw_454]